MSLCVLVLALIALRSFSEASSLINSSLALCNALRWLDIRRLPVTPSRAGSLSVKTDGRFGFLPKTSW